MANLFQKSVEKKYLNEISKDLLKEKFAKFQNHFAKPDIQQNIRGLKEEEYQEGFVRDLFVEILGYTLKPQPNFNIELEKKNVNDSKKADGAILHNEKIIAVIELKGTDTSDLKSVEVQAFGYKNNQPDCKYIITSNFEKLRFYINNAVDHEEFNLFNLTEERFGLLWLCLAKENVLTDLPLKIKNASVLKEENVTKELYKDYSSFKHDLFRNIVELNLGFDKLLLFKKSQKLLDRFLFIFFAEDKSLLPPNSISEIAKQWEELKDLDEYTPLYNRFKKYFGYLNTGHKGKKHNIFAYNGGLFTPDEILDSIIIDDELLKKHVLQFSNYDFESEVDVNILGHIFEHSLNELDLIQSELEGKTIEKNKTKRKKDGVFYTPKYITKYIVENTVGKLCEEKKIELEISDAVYENAKKRSRKRIENIDKYRKWLLSLTICDPACGSGAFLNMALDFLITEHRYLDELTASYHNVPIVFTDVENHILEKNLFGVDLNEESVEIARLSLWLRTAQPGRKLTTLSNNIKCGNSLVDDPRVAGEKAFNWKKEFPSVFEKEGFDVVIGNPPYVRADSPGNDKLFREYMVSCGRYQTLKGKWDLYIPFVELAVQINKRVASLIIPDAFCHAEYSTKSLDFFSENNYLERIDYFPEIEVFSNVGVKSIIVNFSKNKKRNGFFRRIHLDNINFKEEYLENYPVSFRLDFSKSIISENISRVFINQILYISKGIVGNSDEIKYKGEFIVSDLISLTKDEIHSKLYYEGKDIFKFILKNKRWIEYGTERSPKKWSRKGFPEFFANEKIVTMRSPGNEPRSIIDIEGGYFNESAIGFVRWSDLKNVSNKSLLKSFKDIKEREYFELISSKLSLKYLLAIMNSKLIKYELNSDRRSNIHIYPDDWRNIKIPTISNDLQKPFIERIDCIQQYISAFTKEEQNFSSLLQSKFQIEKLNSKMQNWMGLDFKEFLIELKKLQVKLSLSEEAEWMQYFNQQKVKVKDLKTEIDKTEKEIDKMVYALYGLTEEEIKIVENT